MCDLQDQNYALYQFIVLVLSNNYIYRTLGIADIFNLELTEKVKTTNTKLGVKQYKF